MSIQSAMTTVTRVITVAKGVFTPGHLGELTQYLPFELVDDVLEQTRTVQRRLRDLPSRAGVYFVIALGMFPHLGYARVWGKLTAGLGGLDLPRPSEKALRDLRRRLGQPPRDWSGHELALRLEVPPRNMLTQLGEWSRLGFFTRTGSGTYRLNTPPASTSSTTAPDP